MSMTPTAPTDQDCANAVAWLYATLNQDWAGRNALAAEVDPVGLVDALTGMYLVLGQVVTDGNVSALLDLQRDNIIAFWSEQ